MISKRLRIQFGRLARGWAEDTVETSSLKEITEHPAYLAIIEMGAQVVPLILAEYEKEQNHWAVALTKITGENPVPQEHAGQMEKMREDWLKWGSERRYI